MNVIKTESTLLTTCSADSFMKFPNDEASIENLSISINIKKEVSHSDDEFYNSINPSTLINYQVDNLMTIKTESDGIQSMQYNTEIFSQPLLSKIPDAENSIDLKLNQQSISMIKHESMDIKVESHNTSDSSPMTPDLETSLISIKDESYGHLENYKEASTDEYLVLISDLETSLISIKDEDYRKIQISEDRPLDKDTAGIRNTFCDICDKDLASPKSLKHHCSEVHPGNKNYICDMCNKSFKQQYNLKRHKQTLHLNIRGWKCANCDKSFGTKSDLKMHEKMVHLKIRDWKCARCDKSFGTKNAFTRHEKTVHLKIRDWKCSYCDETFGHKWHLKYHERIVHLKIRDWKCSYCDETFGHKWYLKGHERIVHLKIRDWKCNHCNKSFATKAHLKSHSRVHSSDSSEVCDICNKSFRRLQSHKYLVHSERKKNFKCTHCDKLFCTNFKLNRHVQTHLNKGDWKCKICEKSFKFKTNLVRHEKIHSRNGSHISANSSKSNLSL